MNSSLRSRGEVTRDWLAAYNLAQRRQRRQQQRTQRIQDARLEAEAAQLAASDNEYFANLERVRNKLLRRA